MTGLQRYYSHYTHRQVSYYNPVSYALWSESSKLHELGESATLANALETCDTPILFMLPDSQGGYPKQADLYSIEGCTVKKYLSKTKSATIHYKGHTIHLYPISAWFDVQPGHNLKATIQGHRLLQQVLEEHFQPQNVHAGKVEKHAIELLATPGQMGSDLLKRSLPYNKEYIPLDTEIAELIIDYNGTQGRIETFYHGCDTLDTLHCYDGRWMYAACLRHVPVGNVVHDNTPEIALTPPSKSGTHGVIQGFYKVLVTVPDTWQHIGLLPYVVDGVHSYPRKAGYTFETWATSVEVMFAVKQGWDIQVLERILWPNTDKEPEPLKLWCERLVKTRMELAETYEEPFRSMLRSSTRNIMLHTIGSFFRYTKEYDGYTRDPESIPDTSTSEILLPGGIYKFTLPEKLNPLQQALCQPQWATWVYGVVRKKLAEHALQVPFEKLVALRVDGIWTNCPMSYPDTGKVGQFTQKTLLQTSGLQWPKNNRNMLHLVQAVKG